MSKENGQQRKSSKIKSWLAVALFLVLAGATVTLAWYDTAVNNPENRAFKEQFKQETQQRTQQVLTELDQSLEQALHPASQPEAPIQVTPVKADPVPVGPSKEEIKAALISSYDSNLLVQKEQAVRLVETLMAQGKAEWETLKAAGKSDATSKGKLASEYLDKVMAMEKELDQSFTTILAKMEEQLQEQGIEPGEIISGYKTEYEKIKEDTRRLMMDKAKAAIS